MLTVAQAAARLGISPGRVYHLIAAGRLPVKRYGRTILINPAHLRRKSVRERTPGRPRGK